MLELSQIGDIMSIKSGIKSRASAYRNPVYIVYALMSVLLFLFAAFIANEGAGPIEVSIFRTFNSLNNNFIYLFGIIDIFGAIGMIYIVSIIALFRKHYANAIKIFLAGNAAYYLAYALKLQDIRARPVALIESVTVRDPYSIGTLGFPSGHAAVATVLAFTAFRYLPKKTHKPIIVLALLVGISRLFMGVHFPMDLLGGFAVGLFCASVMEFALGTKRFHPVSPEKIKEKITRIGLTAKSVKLASVDARGSTPYFAELTDGTKVFIKVVGRENNIADWLFKVWRKIVYRRLEDETPFLTPKRMLEHETYVSNLALLAGVRTPRALGIFETENDRWAHAQVTIDGKSLDKVDVSQITDKVMLEIWRLVNQLHKNNIVHRDLRCANVFLDVDGTPWLIDFGFSEAGLSDESKNRDRAELLASSATLIGVKRAVKAAVKSLSKNEIESTSRFLNYAVLSSATTKTIKKQKGMLGELQKELITQGKIPKQKPINIKRFSLKNLILVAVIFLGGSFILHSQGALMDSVRAIFEANPYYVILGLVFSALTYVMATFAYKSLSFYPIPYLKMLLVQFASSFASKLAPAGAGGIALNARFLTKNNHNLIQAGSIAAINNMMGFVAHMSILLVLILFGSTSVSEAFNFRISIPLWGWLLAGGIFIFAVGSLGFLPKFRKKIVKTIKSSKETIADYRRHPARLAGSYIASLFVTLSYAGALYMSALALGADLSVIQVIVVFTVGVAAASVTPTPGGIGGAEAGLTAALTGTGIDPDLALSIALLYRLITYWVPILPGFIAFQYSVKKEYV